MRFSEYVTSKELEEDGVWARLRKGDAEVLVARAGNSKHEDLVRRLRKKHGRGFRGDELPPAVEEEIATEAIARTILLDWKGIEDEDGEPIPYSTEEARRLLKLSRDFRLEIVSIATEMEMFRREETAEAEKNSEKSPRGKGRTATS